MKKDTSKTIRAILSTSLFFLINFSVAEDLPSIHIYGNSIKGIHIISAPQFEITGNVQQDTIDENQRRINLEDASLVHIGIPKGRELHISLLEADHVRAYGIEDVRLSLSLQVGSVYMNNISSTVHININRGDLHLEDIKGHLKVHSYLASLSLNKLEGTSEIRTYSGTVEIQNVKGDVDIKSFESPIQLSRVKGKLSFHCEKSDIKLSRFVGDIQGHANKGSIKGAFTPIQTNIQTKSAPIHLYFQNSRAYVEAQSQKNKVYAPGYFYKDRAGGVYRARGRVKGRGDTEGKAVLKSHSGKILIL